MKVAYTSDLHSDITNNNFKLLSHLATRLSELSPDLFVIAGDTANKLEELDKALSHFKELPCLKLFVPGNHDLWIESNNGLRKGRDSFYKYREAIPEICARNNFIYPCSSPYIIEETALIGSIGWYDYSLADSRLKGFYHKGDYNLGRFERAIWNDVRFSSFLKYPANVDWRLRRHKYSNDEVFSIFYDELKEMFKSLDDKIRRVITAIHTAPFAECISPKEEPCPFDAYEGSTKLGELLLEESNKRDIYLIIGHRHRKLYLEKGRVKLYRSPVGYLLEEEPDLAALAEEKLGLFEIEC